MSMLEVASFVISLVVAFFTVFLAGIHLRTTYDEAFWVRELMYPKPPKPPAPCKPPTPLFAEDTPELRALDDMENVVKESADLLKRLAVAYDARAEVARLAAVTADTTVSSPS